jgi:hypothetical protein
LQLADVEEVAEEKAEVDVEMLEAAEEEEVLQEEDVVTPEEDVAIEVAEEEVEDNPVVLLPMNTLIQILSFPLYTMARLCEISTEKKLYNAVFKVILSKL